MKMTLDVRDQPRERPARLKLGQPVGEKRPILRAEMKKDQQVDDAKTRVEEEAHGLDSLMSRLTVGGGCREAAMRDLLGAVVHMAGAADRAALRAATANQSTAEVVEILRRIVEGDKKENGNDLPTEDVEQTDKCDVKPMEKKTVRVPDKLKKIEELKDDADLCPRSPMRLQHQHRNNFPYQNTSRKLHSGGLMSTQASPAPCYQNNADMLFMPAGMTGSSDTQNNLVSSINDITDLDRQLLVNMLENCLGSLNPKSVEEMSDLDMIPTPISELNQGRNIFEPVDHRVPSYSPGDRSSVEDSVSTTWGDYSDESTSGCYSLSPTSILSSSPGGSHLPLSPDSGHVVPDISSEVSSFVPNMSPSGHFFDDNAPYATPGYCPDTVYLSAKETFNFEDTSHVGPAGYSSVGTPSPTFGPPGNAHGDFLGDFETKLQIASNDILCSSHDILDAGDPLLGFPSETDTFLQELVRPPDASPAVGGLGPAYTSLTDLSVPAHLSPNISQSNNYHYNNHSTTQNVIAQNTTFNCSPDLNKNVGTVGYHVSPKVADATSRLTPSFAAGAAAYVDSTPTVVNTSNVQLGIFVPVMQAKLVSPPASNLKQLKPKMERSVRMETGKDRVLKLMDKEKKDRAWAKVSRHLTEMAARDADGDTQLMILCANSNGNENSVLEYTYALVENLRKTPQALSAVNNQNQSALFLAAVYSNYTSRAVVVRYIAETLLELGEDINYISENGNSMLHELCQQGDQRYDVLEELLSLKDKAGHCCFNINLENHEGKTPLHLAVVSHGMIGVSCIKTVRLLIAEGADVLTAENKHHHTALHLAISQSCLPNLVEALLSGPAVSSQLLVNTVNVNQDSPLHMAAARNDVQLEQQMRVIQLLLNHGAAKNHNAKGKFPIALVVEERRQEIRRVY